MNLQSRAARLLRLLVFCLGVSEAVAALCPIAPDVDDPGVPIVGVGGTRELREGGCGIEEQVGLETNTSVTRVLTASPVAYGVTRVDLGAKVIISSALTCKLRHYHVPSLLHM
jgi:hypothetical protein